MTTDRTGPVLDLERLDAAADEALAGVQLDLGAVRSRAAAERHRRGRARWALAAAAAAVVLLGSLVAGGVGALRSAPTPAAVPPGPGSLPAQVFAVPRLVLPVDRAPVGRVAVVLQTVLTRPSGWGAESSTSVVLVSADDGQYRRLPGSVQVGAVSVSGDGRVVAWTDGIPQSADLLGAQPLPRVVRWVQVATGRVGSTGFDYPADRRPTVEDTWLSPDGGALVVQVSSLPDPADLSARTYDTWSVDTTTGSRTVLCRACAGDVAWDARGRLLVDRDGGFVAGRFPDALPPLDQVGAPYTGSAVTHLAFVSADGARRLVVDKDNRSEAGRPEAYRLAEVDAAGKVVSTTPLGTLTDAGLLAWSGRTAWVSVSTADRPVPQVLRVRLGAVPDPQVVLRPAAGADAQGGPYVVAVTADVAAGGRSVPTSPPAGVPWWSQESVRLFGSEHPFVALVPTVLLVTALAPRLRRRSTRPWRAAPPPSRIARAADEAAKDMGGPR
jgi:hypothetical protein